MDNSTKNNIFALHLLKMAYLHLVEQVDNLKNISLYFCPNQSQLGSCVVLTPVFLIDSCVLQKKEGLQWNYDEYMMTEYLFLSEVSF